MNETEFPPEFLPPEGPFPAPCGRCGQSGTARIEHRTEYADPPPGGWPRGVPAARLSLACRSCGSDFQARQDRLTASPTGALRNVAWSTCLLCSAEAAVLRWAWITCTACRYEKRAELDPLGALVPAAEECHGLPPAGAVPELVCSACGHRGGLRVEHCSEWASPPADERSDSTPKDRLARACRQCASPRLLRTSRLAVKLEGAVDGDRALSARETPWALCTACGHGEAICARAWMVCVCGGASRVSV